jgi:hypothetical protein
MRQLSWRWVPRSLSETQKVTLGEVAKEIQKVLHELETNDFDGIATGNEPWWLRLPGEEKRVGLEGEQRIRELEKLLLNQLSSNGLFDSRSKE